MLNISEYLESIKSTYLTGVATEHSYRPTLEKLFASLNPAIAVVNEPRRIAVGAPDFVFNRDEVSVGWVEAKDIDKDLRKLTDYSKEQKERYLKGLPNLIYTNGIDFEFFREGKFLNFISIATLEPVFSFKRENFDELARSLLNFVEQAPVSITSAAKLAILMAGKAAIIKDVMTKLLTGDIALETPLGGQFKAFRADLLPHLERSEFADIYAETITYGMFAARLHDKTLDSFSRLEALELLPRSNPFLRSLFGYIAGPDLDDRIRWIIDDLANILRASDPSLLFKDFGRFTARNDPFIHFYEDFLKAYNPAKRKSRGVWYTPEPVVNFIVRAVDDVLKSFFNLGDGLADTSKVVIDYDTGQTNAKSGKAITVKKEVHRVQVLDPATGTGTFLSEAIQMISNRVKSRAPGKWSGYVEEELIPRLHGLELLMASYAMCHMKLDMSLRETEYEPSEISPRLSVWLTNTLEPGERDVRDLFFTALAEEARGASEIKRNKPIMCVIGNPPYSGESANKGKWITELMEDYKKEPGSNRSLDEKNSKWVNKDEHKFIRLAEEMVDRTGAGVVGLITSHGYISDPTLRGMRWKLMHSFDRIYILDLHGNSNRKENPPDGVVDKNVFDIKQGVAIIVAVKLQRERRKDDSCEVWHSELWGSRASKNEALLRSSIESVDWKRLDLRGPQWVFLHRDKGLEEQYRSGFSLDKLFLTFGNGIVTKRDGLCVQPNADSVWKSMQAFSTEAEEVVRARYSIPDDVRDWRYDWAKADVLAHYDRKFIKPINYRPFDERWMLYTGNARGFVGWPVKQVMENYLSGPNLGLVAPKAVRDRSFAHSFVTSIPTEAIFLSGTTGSNAMNFPLYVYSTSADESKQGVLGGLRANRLINFDRKIYESIREAAGLSGQSGSAGDNFQAATEKDRRLEIRVFDYVYGVLHSKQYREMYAEFLKTDFPRIPYPKGTEEFERISAIGEKLRRLHLMEVVAIGDTPYPYRGRGDDRVARGFPEFDAGKVFINNTQFFDGVPALAWESFVGGYTPAQKWLKDRVGQMLTWSDIRHYQKIVKVLSETERLAREIVLVLN